ncbi:MAG: tRNA (adenosine(37)-N6)-threonylcarbamoyltransferase complex ATPase subunit type 1 TsaE [Candidatus Magasanikbacteria bacterium]|nr:tRNA (adenosine(37)-N6)-threonylcarbamoyltransferase complex ATPase subunit type 1 TsaE [Candidatus Magasanikbacteria bacterium]
MNPTILKNEQATIDAGAAFARKLHGGDVVLLHGELGAGKTTFAKGIAKGLGVKETVTSPTFALMGVYPIPDDEIPRLASLARDDTTGAAHQLCHIDTYRLKNADELRAIGVEDYIGDPHTITIIEWPEKIKPLLKGKKTISLTFTHKKDNTRTLVV